MEIWVYSPPTFATQLNEIHYISRSRVCIDANCSLVILAAALVSYNILSIHVEELAPLLIVNIYFCRGAKENYDLPSAPPLGIEIYSILHQLLPAISFFFVCYTVILCEKQEVFDAVVVVTNRSEKT